MGFRTAFLLSESPDLTVFAPILPKMHEKASLVLVDKRGFLYGRSVHNASDKNLDFKPVSVHIHISFSIRLSKKTRQSYFLFRTFAHTFVLSSFLSYNIAEGGRETMKEIKRRLILQGYQRGGKAIRMERTTKKLPVAHYVRVSIKKQDNQAATPTMDLSKLSDEEIIDKMWVV